MIQYTKSDNTKPIFSSFGLMDRLDMKPHTILVSSNKQQQSVLWVGQFDQLEVKKIIQLGVNNEYFTVSVVIKNIGTTAITDFYCKFLICIYIVYCI